MTVQRQLGLKEEKSHTILRRGLFSLLLTRLGGDLLPSEARLVGTEEILVGTRVSSPACVGKQPYHTCSTSGISRDTEA